MGSTKNTKSLFYGDNKIHKFWETVDHTVLVFKNPSEGFWFIYINGIVRDTRNTLGEAIKRASDIIKRPLKKDGSKIWVDGPDPKKNMRLVSRKVLGKRG